MTNPVDTIKTAVLGNPPVANKKPSRTGIVQAFIEMQQQIDEATLNKFKFANRADLNASTIDSNVNLIMLEGFYSSGDNAAGAYYKRLSASPSVVKLYHTQSADGAWWQLVTKGVHPYLLGAKGDFTGDDAPAWNAMVDYAADFGAECWGAPGNYNMATPLVLRPGPVPDTDYTYYERGSTWRFDNNCVLKATASMVALVQLGNHTYENMIRDGMLEGGVFDQNNFAERGVWATFVNRVVIKNTQCVNVPIYGCGIQVGTTTLNEFGTLAQSYEGIVQNNRVIGCDYSASIAARAGTVGIRYVNTTDNQTNENLISGTVWGIVADFTSGWDGKHYGNHFWNWSTNGAMTAAFDLYGDNMLIGNQHDGPFLYLARLRGPRNHVVGAKVNYGGQDADADGVAALWRLEQDTTIGGVTVTNSGFKATVSKRIAAELSLGSGCTVTDFRKDATNYYSNVLNLQPVSIGNSLSARVLISGGTATLQAGANNASATSRTSAGVVTLTWSRPFSVNVPIEVSPIANGVFKNIQIVEDQSARTTTSARFYCYDRTDTLTDPGGINFSACEVL